MLRKAKRMFERLTGIRLPSCDPHVERRLSLLRDRSHDIANNTTKLQAAVDRRFRETDDVLLTLAKETRGKSNGFDT